MRITRLEVDGFKNLREVEMVPHPSLNLILGNNAQGKTNLLESIWTCTGCRSFRGSKEWDLLGLQQSLMRIRVCFQDQRREQEIVLHMQRGEGRQRKLLRKITLNRVPVQGGSQLFSQFQCVVFSPDDRELIRGGPEKRRAFMDLCGSQLTPAMLGCFRRFELLMAQRNAMLKQISVGHASTRDLIEWDAQLSVFGCQLTCLRYGYLRQMSGICQSFYNRITGGKETLEIDYHSNIFQNSEIPEQPTKEMQSYYLQQLRNSMRDDVRLGFTTKGAGRDDFICKINGLSVKEYGSQGQQKSTALVMRLAQTAVFYDKKNETPMILLDDVMGELDDTRQRLVYDIVKDMQVFLTACHAEAVERQTEHETSFDDKRRNCLVFHMQDGRMNEVPSKENAGTE